MLEKIIEQALFEYMDNEGRQENEEILKTQKEISAVAEKIKAEPKLMDELDAAYTAEETVYQEMYFREGFMTALRLMNEINSVKTLGKSL